MQYKSAIFAHVEFKSYTDTMQEIQYSYRINLRFEPIRKAFFREKIYAHVNSSLKRLVTSHCKHILSNGNSCFLAVLCMMAVRKD